MAKDTGGPAFPRPIGEHHPKFVGDAYTANSAQAGMTLRDYAEIKFIASLLKHTGTNTMLYSDIVSFGKNVATEWLKRRDK